MYVIITIRLYLFDFVPKKNIYLTCYLKITLKITTSYFFNNITLYNMYVD